MNSQRLVDPANRLFMMTLLVQRDAKEVQGRKVLGPMRKHAAIALFCFRKPTPLVLMPCLVESIFPTHEQCTRHIS
jgi:hypothetical protein